MANTSDDGEVVRERPAWLIPLLVAAGVVILSTVFLYYYFGPTPREILGLDPEVSDRAAEVEAVVGGIRYIIPENYTRYPVQRTGGVQREVAMHALLPDMEPYSAERLAEFQSNAPDSPVIHFAVREAGVTLPAEQRMRRVYAKYLDGETPKRDMLGMDRYTFLPGSGYDDQDLFTYRDSEDRLALLLCYRLSPLIDSPNCTRTLLLSNTVALTYRYKRAHRANWSEIDQAVTALVRDFDATPSEPGMGLEEDLGGPPN